VIIKNAFIVLVLGIAATLSSTASAQSLPKFGLRTGLGFSKFTGDISGAEFGMGFGLGGTVVVDLGPIGLATDLYFARRNYANATVSTKTWDLMIPVQVRFFVAPMFFVQSGVIYSHGIGSYTTDDGILKESTKYGEGPFPFSRSDFGFLLGAGAQIPLAIGALEVEGRLNWGLKDRYTLPDRSVKSIGFDLIVGFLF
jgi:hypothetical protein